MLEFALLVVVWGILDVCWLLDGLLGKRGLSIFVHMVMAEIAKFACVAASTNWTNVFSYPEWSLWGLTLVSLHKPIFVVYNWLNFLSRPHFWLLDVGNRVYPVIDALEYLRRCMTLSSIILHKILIQSNCHVFRWRLCKWLVDTLTNQISVPMLGYQTLTYLLNIAWVGTSWILSKVVILIGSVLNCMLLLSLVGSNSLISIWTLVVLT